MLHRRFSIVILFVAVCVPIAEAGAIHYTISFSGAPILPTAGSFNYDSVSPQFTDFIVQWDDWTFDLTWEANNPLIVGDATNPWFQGTTGAAASFLMLSECSSSTSCNGWTASWSGSRDHSQPGGDFEFMAWETDRQYIDVRDRWAQDVIWGTPDGASGSWSINAQAVPEPGSMLLFLGIGLVSVIGYGWRHGKR
jgi:hypothetical protein